MSKIKLFQGDSILVFADLKQGGEAVSPEFISNIEICVDESNIRKTYQGGDLLFDNEEKIWCFRLTQQETFSLEPNSYQVEARVKYPDGTVLGVLIGKLEVKDIHSEEVL